MPRPVQDEEPAGESGHEKESGIGQSRTQPRRSKTAVVSEERRSRGSSLVAGGGRKGFQLASDVSELDAPEAGMSPMSTSRYPSPTRGSRRVAARGVDRTVTAAPHSSRYPVQPVSSGSKSVAAGTGSTSSSAVARRNSARGHRAGGYSRLSWASAPDPGPRRYLASRPSALSTTFLQ